MQPMLSAVYNRSIEFTRKQIELNHASGDASGATTYRAGTRSRGGAFRVQHQGRLGGVDVCFATGIPQDGDRPSCQAVACAVEAEPTDARSFRSPLVLCVCPLDRCLAIGERQPLFVNGPTRW